MADRLDFVTSWEAMTPTPNDPPFAWRALFEARGGLLTAREARAGGLHPQTLARLLARSKVKRAQRGV